MSNEQKGFIVYGDMKAVIDELTDEQVASLFRGMLDYFINGKEPAFSGILKFVFIPVKQQMDRDAEKYEKKCEKNRENANKRWNNNANASERMRTHAMDANTNTNTNTNTNINTNTNTNTKTTTNTNTKDPVVVSYDDEFNIWKRLSPKETDQLYEIYPNTAGDLIQAVYEDVKAKRRKVRDVYLYILGYAEKVEWNDNREAAQ